MLKTARIIWTEKNKGQNENRKGKLGLKNVLGVFGHCLDVYSFYFSDIFILFFFLELNASLLFFTSAIKIQPRSLIIVLHAVSFKHHS